MLDGLVMKFCTHDVRLVLVFKPLFMMLDWEYEGLLARFCMFFSGTNLFGLLI